MRMTVHRESRTLELVDVSTLSNADDVDVVVDGMSGCDVGTLSMSVYTADGKTKLMSFTGFSRVPEHRDLVTARCDFSGIADESSVVPRFDVYVVVSDASTAYAACFLPVSFVPVEAG